MERGGTEDNLSRAFGRGGVRARLRPAGDRRLRPWPTCWSFCSSDADPPLAAHAERGGALSRTLWRLSATCSAGDVAARWLLAALLASPASAGSAAPSRPAGRASSAASTARRQASSPPTGRSPSASTSEQRELNPDGSREARSSRRRRPTDENGRGRAQDAQARGRARRHEDAVRRDRNLMQRFPDEAAHGKAREAALDDVAHRGAGTPRRASSCCSPSASRSRTRPSSTSRQAAAGQAQAADRRQRRRRSRRSARWSRTSRPRSCASTRSTTPSWRA